MNSLEKIIQQNRDAHALGLLLDGQAVGVQGFHAQAYLDRQPDELKRLPPKFPGTLGHSLQQGGLRGHSIGDLYPWSVTPHINPADGSDFYQVENLLTGVEFTTEYPTFEAAELVAEARKALDSTAPKVETLHEASRIELAARNAEAPYGYKAVDV